MAWTLCVFDSRRNSWVTPSTPWSEATASNEHQNPEALEWHPKEVVLPLTWMSSFWVQINCTVQCSVPSPDFVWYDRFDSKLDLRSIFPGKSGNLTKIWSQNSRHSITSAVLPERSIGNCYLRLRGGKSGPKLKQTNKQCRDKVGIEALKVVYILLVVMRQFSNTWQHSQTVNTNERKPCTISESITPGTRGGPGGHDRTLAVKEEKRTKISFFS